MDREPSTHARSEPTLPNDAPRVHLNPLAGTPIPPLESCQPVILIGSRRDCDLYVSQGDVSKIHCALVNTGTAVIATDLCSRTGTFVNSQSISAVALRSGDELRIGEVCFEVQLAGQPATSLADAVNRSHAPTTLSTPLRLISIEQRYELASLPAVIGRRNTCQVVLDTPDVSLAHGLLFAIVGCPVIFDLGSRSGTYLNGKRVSLAWLHDGERLCIGGEELLLEWEGPQHAECEAASGDAASAGDSTGARSERSRVAASGLDSVVTTIDGPELGDSVSQGTLAKRSSLLDQREATLQAREAELEERCDQLAAERQRVAQQAAELHAAQRALQQERSRLEAERAQRTRDRASLDAQRADLDRRSAEQEAALRRLSESASALDEREAAVAAAEQAVARRQAELAAREAATARAAREIEQLRDVLSEARRMFASFEALPDTPRTPPAVADPAAQSTGPPAAADPDSRVSPDLPAPMVDEPLFRGLDPASPEHWPHEWQERLQFLRRTSGQSEADALSQVLAEFRARRPGRGRPSGGARDTQGRRWVT